MSASIPKPVCFVYRTYVLYFEARKCDVSWFIIFIWLSRIFYIFVTFLCLNTLIVLTVENHIIHIVDFQKC